jgi:hypothetical protein
LLRCRNSFREATPICCNYAASFDVCYLSSR